MGYAPPYGYGGAPAAPMYAAARPPYPPPQPSPWIEYFTQDGRPYYYNSITQVTQWERPPEMSYGAPIPQGGTYGGPPAAATGVPQMASSGPAPVSVYFFS